MSSAGHWWESLLLTSELPEDNDYIPRVYSPGNLVVANHRLLEDFRDNDFVTMDLSYTSGLLLLGTTFLLGAFLACLVLPYIFVSVRKVASHLLTRRLTTKTASRKVNTTLLLVLGFISLTTLMVIAAGLVKVDVKLTAIANRAEDVAESLRMVLTVPELTRSALINAETVFDSVQENAQDCTSRDEVETFDVAGLRQDLEEELLLISTSGLGELVANVGDLANWVSATTGVWRCVVWPIIALCMLMIAAYTINGLVHRGAWSYVQGCRSRSFFVRPLTVFVAFLVITMAACAISLSAMVGDFCIDPNAHVVVLLSESDQPTVEGLLEYYAKGCSTKNMGVETLSTAQDIARGVIGPSLETLWEATSFCQGMAPSVQAFDASIKQTWSILEEAGWLASCRNINGLYQSVAYDHLCGDLLGEGLMVLVSCAILSVMLLLMVVQWTRMLRRGEARNNVPYTEQRLETGETYKTSPRRKIDRNRSARTAAHSPRELSPMIRSPERVSPSTRSPSSSRKFSRASLRQNRFSSQKRAMSIAPKLSPTKSTTLSPVSTLPLSSNPTRDGFTERHRSKHDVFTPTGSR